MKQVSIRLRLTAWYSVVLALGLVLFGVVMWFALQQRLMAGVDSRLGHRLQGLRSALGTNSRLRNNSQLRRELTEFANGTADGSLFELRDGSGEMLRAASEQPELPPDVFRTEGDRFTVERNGRRYRVAAGELDAAGSHWQARVATRLDEVTDVLRDFRRLLFLLVPAVLGLACLGGYWLSMRALRAVDQITTVARSISVRNLSQRIVVPHTGDELQRMAEAWNAVLEHLESSVRRIRQFTADASHELRTPLALIRTTAEVALRRERSAEEYRDSLRDIERDAKRLTVLSESLLSLARADSERLDMPLAPLDLNPVVASVVDQYRPLAAERGIQLQMETTGTPAVANANESGVTRLLTILVDNAVKYTGSRGSVQVTTESTGEGIRVSVSDTGVGISADALPHVFDRFFRADEARAGAGFGLGLSIAQAIAQAHGSRIIAESALRKGSRFSVALKA